MTTTVHDLATALDGVVVPHHGDDRVLTADGMIYVAPTGKVKLQRAGHIIATLGMRSDSAKDIADAYRAAVGAVAS